MRNRFQKGAAGTKNGRLFTRPARIVKEPMLSLSESMGFLTSCFCAIHGIPDPKRGMKPSVGINRSFSDP